MNAERHRLLAGDFVPTPLTGKAAFLPGWQKLVPTPAEIDRWPAGNTGLLTAWSPAIDIDVLDVEVAERIEEMVFEVAGATLVRTGRAPKRALLYRTDVPFRKITSPRFERGWVEVLGLGQQLAAFGVHPETGRPYEWRPHPPVRRADLPVLGEAVARHVIVEATKIMEAAGWIATQPGSIGRRHAFSLQVAGVGDELPKPIYLALLEAMPLDEVKVERRHRRWAASILRNLVALSTGRNAGLCGAVVEFREVIEQDRISPEGARALLVMACTPNGYAAKVGVGRVHAIISSMLQPPEGRTGGGKRGINRR